MAVLWMKSSCSSCRKARTLLAELGVDVAVRDYFRKPLTWAELDELLPEDPTPFLSRKSPAFRKLERKDASFSKAEAIALIVSDNNLLKRPVLVHPKGILLGFDVDAYEMLASPLFKPERLPRGVILIPSP